VTCLEGCGRGGRRADSTSSSTRTTCDLLLDQIMLLRGYSTRACQLPNLFTLEFPNEGVTPCWPVIMVMDQGKTNQFGKRDYAACIRNKEVIACPVRALAFYLFYCWHRGRERFPDFTSRRHWYDTFLLKGKRRPARDRVRHAARLGQTGVRGGRRRYNQEDTRRPRPGSAGG
jgi:hypothetical protein